MVKRSAWLLVFLVIAAACLDEPDCFNLNNDVIGISFKRLEDSRTDTVSLVAYGVLVEPPLYAGVDTAVSKVYMPLNYFEDETTYVFETYDARHLLRLGYVSQAQFVSENCGEKFVLSRLRIIDASFDSVRLVIDTPTSEAGTIHIEIFQ